MRRVALLAASFALAGSWSLASLDILAAPSTTTFTRDVAPILHAKCVTCHRPGEVAPMALLTYQDARPWARSIKEKVTSRQMPPWFADRSIGTFTNDPSLTEAEIATIARWVDGGAPQGNMKDMPALPTFTEGWQLGEPDQIVELPEVQIPATGSDYFPTPSIDLNLTEDRWVRAIEVRPSNRAVTHHSVIFSVPRNLLAAREGGLFDVLAVWAVGTPPTVYPEGTGRWIRKGQTLRTNLHYHPNGTAQTDRTRVGLYFGKGELKKEVAAALAGNVTFTIPPNAQNHELRALYVVDQDISVVSLFPHMHLRGKDMTMTATYPGGRRETLLNVPAYDFNWQLFYYPTQRIALPRGTRIDLVAHYDNSAANKHNPDPTSTVRFGEASTSEMMFGLFEFTAAEGGALKPQTARSRMEALMQTLPAESFLVEFPFAEKPTPAVLHLSHSGEGAVYLPAAFGTIAQQRVQDLQWDGSAFRFQTAFLVGGPGGGFYNVTGSVGEDGTIRGTLQRRGNTQPPSYDFSGERKK